MHTECTQMALCPGVWGWNPPPVRPDAEAPVVALVRIGGRSVTVGTGSVALLGALNGRGAAFAGQRVPRSAYQGTSPFQRRRQYFPPPKARACSHGSDLLGMHSQNRLFQSITSSWHCLPMGQSNFLRSLERGGSGTRFIFLMCGLRRISPAYIGCGVYPRLALNFAGVGGARRRRARLTLYEGEQCDGGHHG
jgi:hypothetical protein